MPAHYSDSFTEITGSLRIKPWNPGAPPAPDPLRVAADAINERLEELDFLDGAVATFVDLQACRMRRRALG